MAPVVEALSDWTLKGFSSLEMYTTSFLLLIILVTLLIVCVRCHRKTDAQTKTEHVQTNSQNGTSLSQTPSNGTSVKVPGQGGMSDTLWRDHKNMPAVPDIQSRSLTRNTLAKTPPS